MLHVIQLTFAKNMLNSFFSFFNCCLVVSIGVVGAFCCYGHHCNDVCAMKCMLLVVFIVCRG
jgi:hypothetical protein